MILCIDVGNTDIVLGVFQGEELQRTARFKYIKGLSAWEYLPFLKDKFNLNFIDYQKVEGCVLCCVAQSTLEGLRLALETVLGVTPFVFSNDEKCGMGVKIGDPKEVGTDIVASCLAVKNSKNLPAIVIDMGTATTLTALDEDGDILGVSILTGVLKTAPGCLLTRAYLHPQKLSAPPQPKVWQAAACSQAHTPWTV
ncbi:MAG: type III pantothenate kinase [Oscillospiraceae bacterium]